MSVVAQRLDGPRWHLARRWALWSTRHCAMVGTQLPSPKSGQNPQFSVHLYCGQAAGCIKMPLGMEVGFSPGDCVLDGDPAPSSQRGGAPQFSAHVYCGQTAAENGCSLHQDTTWYRGRPRPTCATLCYMGISSPPLKGNTPNFWPMSVVATITLGIGPLF